MISVASCFTVNVMNVAWKIGRRYKKAKAFKSASIDQMDGEQHGDLGLSIRKILR